MNTETIKEQELLNQFFNRALRDASRLMHSRCVLGAYWRQSEEDRKARAQKGDKHAQFVHGWRLWNRFDHAEGAKWIYVSAMNGHLLAKQWCFENLDETKDTLARSLLSAVVQQAKKEGYALKWRYEARLPLGPRRTTKYLPAP